MITCDFVCEDFPKENKTNQNSSYLWFSTKLLNFFTYCYELAFRFYLLYINSEICFPILLKTFDFVILILSFLVT